ncbi:FecR family protein [Woodsholea maritima]|uniref:FecR family protein n=1 Tax=Woodsholea maritima TaxID=240237 RepID=UPI00039F7180|nr:FecR domain-containing protein [Woodsholea maritima]
MNNKPTDPTSRAHWRTLSEAELETAAHLALLDEPERTRESAAWIGDNAQRREAFLAMGGTWSDEAMIAAAVELYAEPNETSAEILSFKPRAKPAALTRHWAWMGAAGAIAASLMVAVALFMMQVDTDNAPQSQNYASLTGVTQDVALDDGSHILLNAQSGIHVSFSDDRRAIALNTGQAYFDVAPDRERPFVVSTQGVDVRAVGTEFDVEQRGQDVIVKVFEGVVAVSFDQSQDPMMLQAGQWTRILPGLHPQVSVFNPASLEDWRTGWIVFEDEPLEGAVETLARYTPQRIWVSARHSDLPVTGRFRLDQPIETLGLISDLEDLELDITETRIEIR